MDTAAGQVGSGGLDPPHDQQQPQQPPHAQLQPRQLEQQQLAQQPAKQPALQPAQQLPVPPQQLQQQQHQRRRASIDVPVSSDQYVTRPRRASGCRAADFMVSERRRGICLYFLISVTVRLLRNLELGMLYL
ncbi:uncharacterized protein LOC144109595 [Amblyomma americanum]